MSKILSALLVLLLVSCLAASTPPADYSWIALSEIKPEDLPPNLNRETSHQLLLKFLSNRTEDKLLQALRTEFLTMGQGKSSYRLISDENENKEYHAVAEACQKLSIKLPYLTAVTEILRKAFKNGTKIAFQHRDITRGLPAMKEIIEKSMQETPALYEEYQHLKNESLAKPLPADYKIYSYEIPKTIVDAKSVAAESLNRPEAKKHMLLTIFANQARNSSSKQESSLLVKSILKMAKDPQISVKVQTLFDEVVAEAVNKIEDIDGQKLTPMYVRNKFERMAKEFFTLLASKFENDPAFKTKIAKIKAETSNSR